MPEAGRNDPCPCGSGHKTKRCCGQRRGPSEDQPARARLAVLGADAIDDLVDVPEDLLDRLDHNLFDLPELDLSLHVKLPALGAADRNRLARAMAADVDDDQAWDQVMAMVDQVDTPQQRVRLTDAVLRLRDQGQLSRAQAAYAVYDLSRASRLITASTIHALAIYFGGDPTPAGLLVAA